MPKVENPIFAEFVLECTYPRCKMTRKVQQAHSAGWKVGDLVPHDKTTPTNSKCPRCKRHMMKVLQAPPTAPVKPPAGFSRIPTK